MIDVFIDIEADALEIEQVKNVWCVVTEELNTGVLKEFTNKEEFNEYARGVNRFIGHNFLSYDLPVLNRVWNSGLRTDCVTDTLLLSRLDHVKREGGHSLKNWGELLGYAKDEFNEFDRLSDELVARCIRDVQITKGVYYKLRPLLKGQEKAIQCEHEIQLLCDEMHDNGFAFDKEKADKLYAELCRDENDLFIQLAFAFPPAIIQLKTKTKEIPFNPGSPKQVIDRIHEHWEPTDKTKAHIEAEKTGEKLEHYKKYGWKINETNMATLKDTAPPAAHLLVKWRLVAARISKLEEWFKHYNKETGRIHGNFNGLGTWTHRFTHNNPNQANVAAEKSIKYKTAELNALATDLGRRMRELFIAEEFSWLVGVDAEGIQLRVLAHYINDKAFTESVINGKKEDKTDVHSINQSTISLPGVDRDSAKTFIYAWILGAGIGKIASIFGTDQRAASDARGRFEGKYEGLKYLKGKKVKDDAQAGGFVGFDGRFVRCDSAHHMLAGYLQAGEAVIMKFALVEAMRRIKQMKLTGVKLINFVHDELIFEVKGGKHTAELVQTIVESCIDWAGQKLRLNCPMKGKGAVGRNWLEVH